MFFSQNIKWSTEFTFCNVTHIIVRKHLLKLFSENSAYSIFVITVFFWFFFLTTHFWQTLVIVTVELMNVT